MSVLHQDSGGIGKSIPSALEISLGHGFCTPRPREISPRAAIIDYCCLAGSNHCCLAKPSSSPATCRLCEYQCCLAANNDLHSIAVDSAWWINAACQATIVNNSRSGAQGISTNIALPKGGLLGYNEICWWRLDNCFAANWCNLSDGSTLTCFI